MPKSKKSSFTLIEILVAIAVIAVLAVILLPTMQSSRERAKRALCANNLRQIYIVMNLFADDHDGQFVGDSNARWIDGEEISLTHESFFQLIPRYTDDMFIFWCPSLNTSGMIGGNRMGPRAYFANMNMRWNTNYICYKNLSPSSGSEAVLVLDDVRYPNVPSLTQWNMESNHKNEGGNELFCDGHIRWVNGRKPILNPPGTGELLLGWYPNK